MRNRVHPIEQQTLVAETVGPSAARHDASTTTPSVSARSGRVVVGSRVLVVLGVVPATTDALVVGEHAPTPRKDRAVPLDSSSVIRAEVQTTANERVAWPPQPEGQHVHDSGWQPSHCDIIAPS